MGTKQYRTRKRNGLICGEDWKLDLPLKQSPHTGLYCRAIWSGALADIPPRNLHCKDTDCFKRLDPNTESLFWWSTGWPVNNNNIYTCVHLCKLALAYTARGNSLLTEAGWEEGRQNLPQSTPFYCVGNSKFDFSIIVQTRAKPGAALQTPLCFIQSFIHSFSHTVLFCKNICMTTPLPNGWKLACSTFFKILPNLLIF